MSELSLISHHLFVAALEPAAARPAGIEPAVEPARRPDQRTRRIARARELLQRQSAFPPVRAVENETVQA
jgi:hypothetical protein